MSFNRYLSALVNLTILCQYLVASGEQTIANLPPANSGQDVSGQNGVSKSGLLEKAIRTTTEKDQMAEKAKTHSNFDIKMAPKYMLDLYERYKNGKIHRGKQIANTVRSIQAEIGVVNTQNMFVFNLSSVLWSEKILRAEIHVYKRRTKSGKQSNIFMDMHELGPTFIRKLDHRRIPEASYGWQAADVTTAVQACRHHGDGLPRMMAIGFMAPKENEDKVEAISVKSLVRRISRPYLIVYSNDTQNITTDHIQPHLNPKDLTSSYVEPSTGTLERFSAFGRDKRESAESEGDGTFTAAHTPQKWFGDNKFFEYFTSIRSPSNILPSSSSKNSKENAHNEVYDVRSRRSILDNEIPEDPDEEIKPDDIYKVPNTHPDMLKGRTPSSKKPEQKAKTQKKNGKGEQLIPYPDNYKKKHRKHRKNRRKNRRQKNRKQDFNNLKHDGWDIEGVMSDNDLKQMCSKRTLTVDFADIGWSEWIISPRSFDANYCAGSCPFPLAQRLKPSNHATIQSLIHAIGLNAKVPSPCCVADKMSSVTLLFFDDNKNVVLKNYPDMSVESCMCR